MLDYIKGEIVEVIEKEDIIIVEAQDFGIAIKTPHKFTVGKEKIFTYLLFKDDKFILYGFKDRLSRELFTKLININGIGVKHAFSILKNFDYEQFIDAVENERTDILSSVEGIGKKTASRIILELKGKLTSHSSPILSDAVEALVSLGFDKQKVQKVVKEVSKNTSSLEEIIKISLQKLSEKR